MKDSYTHHKIYRFKKHQFSMTSISSYKKNYTFCPEYISTGDYPKVNSRQTFVVLSLITGS